MDWWEENLVESTLGYIEVPVASRKLGLGLRVARTDYPYRKGQGIEALGGKAQTFTVMLPLYRGLISSDPDLYYPNAYQRLIALIEDEDQRGSVEWVDPEFGPVPVQIIDYDIDADASKRDGVMMTIVLEERGLDQSLLTHLSQPKLAGASRAALFAAQVDQEVAFTDVPQSEKPSFSLTQTWQDFQAALDTGALAADQIAARLDEVYMVANRFIEFSAKDEIERWSLFNSVVDFAGAAEDAANQTAANQSNTAGGLIEVVLQADMSAYDIGSYYYDDAGRADDIIADNPTANPMRYPRGTTVLIGSDAKTPAQRPGYGANQ
jgi:hypothetical protein